MLTCSNSDSRFYHGTSQLRFFAGFCAGFQLFSPKEYVEDSLEQIANRYSYRIIVLATLDSHWYSQNNALIDDHSQVCDRPVHQFLLIENEWAAQPGSAVHVALFP